MATKADLLKDIEKLKNNKDAKNERGVGRKIKFKNEQVEKIKKLGVDEKTIKEIVELYKFGTATVNIILKRKSISLLTLICFFPV